MAIGKGSDFVIYHEEFFGGFSETLEQNTNAFNAASNGAIRMTPNRLRGDYEKESFIKSVTNLVTRRDLTSTSGVTDLAMTQGENVGVKINRKIGPVANTLDSFKKIARDPQEMSFLLGQQVGQGVAVDMLNTAVAALDGALRAQASQLYDGTAGTPTHGGLVQMIAKMGDAGDRITAFIMHSKSYYDLVGQAITDKITDVANVAIYQGTTATLGRPVVVTDAPALLVSGTPDEYGILGLVDEACTINESEERNIVSDTVTGLENLVLRIQGEYAYNLKLKGMTWDITNGGANPLDAAVATGTNWDQVATDDKSLPGVIGRFD